MSRWKILRNICNSDSMRILLDTHTLIWFLSDSPDLSPSAKSMIESSENEVVVSVASLWEMSIKSSLGKLHLHRPFEEFIQLYASTPIQTLPITIPHLLTLQQLPFHHRDPFDRILISQSIAENLSLISRDAAFTAYDITQIW